MFGSLALNGSAKPDMGILHEHELIIAASKGVRCEMKPSPKPDFDSDGFECR
jgi:hypothetical protein